MGKQEKALDMQTWWPKGENQRPQVVSWATTYAVAGTHLPPPMNVVKNK